MLEFAKTLPRLQPHRSMLGPIPPQQVPILIVDDELAILRWEGLVLERNGMGNVVKCSDSRVALGLVESELIGLVILDLGMPYIGGEQLLGQLLAFHPELPVIVVTGEQDLASAVRCMRLGARDYITKPLTSEQLVKAVESAMLSAAVDVDIEQHLRASYSTCALEHPEAFADILTSDPGMLHLFQHIETISKGSHPVFISGETGTGKELVARALHRAGGSKGPFVAVNVAGLDEFMFADALFGHRRGAFTGAQEERKGMIEAARDGVLFLDEIGDLTEPSQVKLLRLLQEKEYFPLGGDRPQELRARIVTATHKDPRKLRQDLYFRLRSYRVDVPPLRQRLGDLPQLIEQFLRAAAKDLGKRKPAVPSELFVYLCNYAYPGNVRELQAMVFDSMARHTHGALRLNSFLEHIRGSRALERDQSSGKRAAHEVLFPNPLPTMRQIEVAAVEEAIERSDGNRSAAARLLGISRPTIQRHLGKHG